MAGMTDALVLRWTDYLEDRSGHRRLQHKTTLRPGERWRDALLRSFVEEREGVQTSKRYRFVTAERVVRGLYAVTLLCDTESYVALLPKLYVRTDMNKGYDLEEIEQLFQEGDTYDRQRMARTGGEGVCRRQNKQGPKEHALRAARSARRN